MKLNCWEFKKCRREPGGELEKELGTCPATTETRLDGMHGGKNGGRSCWVVVGTFCAGKPSGTFSQKYKSCLECDFYGLVRREEGMDFNIAAILLGRLKA